jgi:hypothetical protein
VFEKSLSWRSEQLGNHIQALKMFAHPALGALDEEALGLCLILATCTTDYFNAVLIYFFIHCWRQNKNRTISQDF